MKKVLIATTLMTSVAGISNQKDAFAKEEDIQKEILNLGRQNRETILKGKVVNLKSGDTLNVREKSNADSKILFKLNSGDIVTVLNKESNGWYKIQKESQVGYVNGNYISTYTETVTTPDESNQAVVTGAINLRETASWSGDIITVISGGEKVTVISKGSDWTKVSYKGTEGYAPTSYLNFIDNENSENTKPEESNIATTTGDVNLRKTASWSGDIIAVVSTGEKVTVISKDSDWTKVSYKNNEGYVPTSYLSFSTSGGNNENNSETPSNGITETNMSSKGKVVKIASNDVLNVRKEPNGDATKVATLKLNQVVDITKKTSNGWYKISVDGVEGYVNWNYIEIIEDSNTQDCIEYITTDRVNLRNTKSWSSTAVILTIEKNEAVDVLEKDSDWAKVSYSNKIGYVPVNYIKLVGNDTGNQNPSVSDKVGKIGTVNTSNLNIRSGPSTSYAIISKVYNGDTILIKEVSSNGWYKVETTSGIIGWCSGDYISNIREGSLPSYGNTDYEKINNVLKVAREQLGKPYVYGATGPDSFDCSGLTSYVFKNGAGITLPRTSKDQSTAGRYVSKSELQPGDLIFFNTSGSGISHVGIYIGNDEMIHAPSSGKNVEVTKITSNYWASKYVTARRIIG